MNHNQLFREIANDICEEHRTTVRALSSKGQRSRNQILAIQAIHLKFKPFGLNFLSERLGISTNVLQKILEDARALQPEKERKVLHAWSDKKAFAPQKASEIMKKIVSLQ